MSTCPCGGVPVGASYAACCEPALTNLRWPVTAEMLMRSRYTAFALHHEDHLFRTWHPRTRPAVVGADQHTRWTGLRVLDVQDGLAGDTGGLVEFRAEYTDAAGAGVLHETSRFEKRAGRWLYLASVDDVS